MYWLICPSRGALSNLDCLFPGSTHMGLYSVTVKTVVQVEQVASQTTFGALSVTKHVVRVRLAVK